MAQRPEIILVVGARPNFMKVAPILRATDGPRSPFKASLVHTGQHYAPEMSDVFLEQLGLTSIDAHLNVGSGSHGSQTARILESFEAYLMAKDVRPAGVVVVGDVNSTLACALAAVKLRIPVAHVEAGLRSFDRTMPEEINRIATDAVADLHLVSEPDGIRNLLREGIPGHKLVHVGNVMIDSLVCQLAEARALAMPGQLELVRGGYALVTLHRPANVDDPMKLARLVEFLADLSRRLPVVFPVHPRTRARLLNQGLLAGLDRIPRVRLLDPLGYREHLGLMLDAKVVMTDSGGIQEETTYLHIPCLTLRPNTERPVTVELGTNTLVGDDLGAALELVERILEGRYKSGSRIFRWDGRAAERILLALTDAWGGGDLTLDEPAGNRHVTSRG